MNQKTAKLIAHYNNACPMGISDRVMKRAWAELSPANKTRSRRAMLRFLKERRDRMAHAMEVGSKIREKSEMENSLVREISSMLPEMDD